jgi:hypothetical protein
MNDEKNNEVSVTLETGKKKNGKEWTGVRVRIGKFNRVVFPYPNQVEDVKRILEENK